MSGTAAGDMGFVLANERDAPPVDEQPRVEVHCWRLFRMQSGAEHLVTMRSGGIARVTSSIASINCAERTFTTESGRVYAILTPPEVGELESRILNAAAASVLGVLDALDVSVATWARMGVDDSRVA